MEDLSSFCNSFSNIGYTGGLSNCSYLIRLDDLRPTLYWNVFYDLSDDLIYSLQLGCEETQQINKKCTHTQHLTAKDWQEHHYCDNQWHFNKTTKRHHGRRRKLFSSSIALFFSWWVKVSIALFLSGYKRTIHLHLNACVCVWTSTKLLHARTHTFTHSLTHTQQ